MPVEGYSSITLPDEVLEPIKIRAKKENLPLARYVANILQQSLEPSLTIEEVFNLISENNELLNNIDKKQKQTFKFQFIEVFSKLQGSGWSSNVSE